LLLLLLLHFHLSPGTYLPKAINPIHAKEPVNDMATAGLEAKAVMSGAVEDLLAKTGAQRCGCGHQVDRSCKVMQDGSHT
jgi:hypothetical protein